MMSGAGLGLVKDSVLGAPEGESQSENQGIPEFDDFVLRVLSVVSDLSRRILTLPTAFRIAYDILSESPRGPEETWDRCREELPCRVGPRDVLLFRARVEYELNTAYAVEALEDLVKACGDRAEVLRDAAEMRFEMADETARRLYKDERPQAMQRRDRAVEELRSLYSKGAESSKGKVKEIRQAQAELERAEFKLGKLRDEYYVDEVEEALAWAVSADALDPGSQSPCDLVIKLQQARIRRLLDSGMICVNRVVLLDGLRRSFGEGDLRDLCYELRVSYEDLPGEDRASAARELVKYLDRRGRLHELVESCARRRPNVSWWRRADARGRFLSPERCVQTRQM